VPSRRDLRLVGRRPTASRDWAAGAGGPFRRTQLLLLLPAGWRPARACSASWVALAAAFRASDSRFSSKSRTALASSSSESGRVAFTWTMLRFSRYPATNAGCVSSSEGQRRSIRLECRCASWNNSVRERFRRLALQDDGSRASHRVRQTPRDKALRTGPQDVPGFTAYFPS